MRIADALELVLLQHSQQFDLDVHRHLADFIQKNGACMGQFEAADAALDRAAERATLVTEQLALHEADGEGRAVDLDEWLFRARTARMQRPRDEFLAGPALAGN